MLRCDCSAPFRVVSTPEQFLFPIKVTNVIKNSALKLKLDGAVVADVIIMYGSNFPSTLQNNEISVV